MNIRKLLKSNKTLSRIAYGLRNRRCQALLSRFGKLPLDANKVLFYRTGGGYGDNPRAVAEYLHIHAPNLKLVWACGSETYLPSMPDYVSPVIFESEEFFRELATAGAWVCSTTLPNGIVKRPGQLYIQTWHGDKFLKKIGNDSAADNAAYQWRRIASQFCEQRICDFFVTGCEWFVAIAASALSYSGNFLRCGMPRNDCLINLDPDVCAATRVKLGLQPEQRILIYAPTFRDYEKTNDEIGSNIDLIQILDALEKKHGCAWRCLLRAHGGRHLTIQGSNVEDPRFLDVTLFPDMADLLMISDMLISDYSSCAADFALTGRMALMYQDDIDTYTSKGRTLYFSPEQSPYFTVSNMEQALNLIERVTDDEIRKNCESILTFYDSFETGHAAQTVSETILESLSKLEALNTKKEREI